MEKEVELFDKRFVRFMWDDELEGKKVFTADDMESLIKAVNNNHSRREVSHTISNLNTVEYDLRNPFRNTDTLTVHQFAYYDPNYSVKRAYYKEGKTIQWHHSDGRWIDDGEPVWDSREYRIKPECPCEDGIDSKACVGCEHSEDGKPHPFENYHCYVCDKPEEEKSKRMTYRQLAEWANKQNGEIKSPADPGYVFCDFSYREGLENEELPEGYKIRYWGSDEWIEPTVELYEADCKENKEE